MKKVFFSEEQQFRHSIFIWILVIPLLITLVLMVKAIYVEQGINNSLTENMSPQAGAVIASIFTFVVVGIAFTIMFKSKLTTEISNEGIKYRFVPFVNREKLILHQDIEKIEVGKYRPITEFGGWGVRRRLISRKTAYNISGNQGMRIWLKNGQQILIGTQKASELKLAVEKLQKYSETNTI
jgi:hypothetical protein